MNARIFHTLPAEGRTSSEVYARELVTALASIVGDDVILEDSWPRARLRSRVAHRPMLARAAGLVDRYVIYQWQVRAENADVNHIIDHGYGHLALTLDPARTVLTFHDAILLKFQAGELARGAYSRITALGHRLSVAGIVRCARVIVDSQSSRTDLLRFTSTDPRRVRVIPLGVSSRFRPADAGDPPSVLGDHQVPRILHVGHSGWYKNVEGILRVLPLVEHRLGTRVEFVKVGAPLTQRQQVLAYELGVTDRVRSLVSLADTLLPSVYRESDVLLMPSFYEGFGLPACEAMASGLPVVASRRGSLPEVVGDAGLLVEPDDLETIADAVERVISDTTLRRELHHRGLHRAREFTWVQTATATLRAYEEVAAEASEIAARSRRSR